MTVLERIERICSDRLDERELRVGLLAEIRSHVPCSAYVWLLTDPETSVGCAPLAEIPAAADIPTVIRSKYLAATNRWTRLPPGSAVGLADAGDRASSGEWTDLLAGLGVDDVVSVVFRDQHGCWGFLDLWRIGGTFGDDERHLLASMAPTVTAAIRHRLAPAFTPVAEPEPHREPIVLLLGDDLHIATQTQRTDAYLRELLPTEPGAAPVPAAAYNVAAQLLAQEAGVDPSPPWARVHLRGGTWVTLSAARMATPAGNGPSIAVSVEPTSASDRTALFGRVMGLTGREAELLGHLVRGTDTHHLARSLVISEHTVQDHLKSIFAKTGATNRRVLVARATGAG